MTQLAEKLRAAGVETPEDKLRATVRAAAERHPRSYDSALDSVLHSCRRDIDLMYALVWKFATNQAKERLNAAYAELNADKRICGKTGTSVDAKYGLSPAYGEGGDQDRAGSQVKNVTPRPSNAIAGLVILSKLDTFLVNGCRIGDCTPDEVRDWLKSRRRDVRFAERLIANLPPDRPIREFVRAEEVEKIWEESESE